MILVQYEQQGEIIMLELADCPLSDGEYKKTDRQTTDRWGDRQTGRQTGRFERQKMKQQQN